MGFGRGRLGHPSERCSNRSEPVHYRSLDRGWSYSVHRRSCWREQVPKSASHYTRDTLRVVLHTRHKEGTTYILPSRNRGFDAVWGPKIENENEALDEAVQKFQDDGGFVNGKLTSMDKVMAAFNAATDLTIDDINDFAAWLYEPEQNAYMCRISCNRAPGIHLISFSVMAALWRAEYPF